MRLPQPEARKRKRYTVRPATRESPLSSECVPISVKEFDRIASFAKEKAVDLVIVGPDDPLAEGLVDVLEEAGTAGPSAPGRTRPSWREARRFQGSDEKVSYSHGGL